MRGNRSDSGERPETVLHSTREGETQRRGDDNALSVTGRIGSDARDTITDTNTMRFCPQCFDDPGTRIAGGQQVVEPSPHRRRCGADALAPRLLDDLAGKIGSVARLAEQALRCGLRNCLLGSS